MAPATSCVTSTVRRSPWSTSGGRVPSAPGAPKEGRLEPSARRGATARGPAAGLDLNRAVVGRRPGARSRTPAASKRCLTVVNAMPYRRPSSFKVWPSAYPSTSSPTGGSFFIERRPYNPREGKGTYVRGSFSALRISAGCDCGE
jgi:hypothetical protein